VPHPAWYLNINPHNTLPTLIYRDTETLTDSRTIATFLADTFPGICPASSEPDGALERARISLFVDAYMDRVNPLVVKTQYKSRDEEERLLFARDLVEAVEREVEPLLKDTKPFFGGSERLSLAEVRSVHPSTQHKWPYPLKHTN
jgi:glutathione S-transferase